MSGENVQPEAQTQPQAQASELQPGQAPADGGAANAGDGAQPEGQELQPQETEEQRNKKRERFDRRFSDLSNRARDAELKAARLEGELNALRRNGGHQRPEPEPQAQPAPSGPPDPSKYPQGAYDPRYAADLAKFEIRQENEEAERVRESRAREAAQHDALLVGAERLQTTIDAALDAAGHQEHGEYFQNAPRFLEFAKANLPVHVVDLITEAKNPVHVAELLGRDPGSVREDLRVDVRQLARMTPVQAARAIATLDAHVSHSIARQKAAAQPAARAQPAPQPSPAPIPTAPGAGGAPLKDPSQMSMKEYAAWRDAGGGR